MGHGILERLGREGGSHLNHDNASRRRPSVDVGVDLGRREIPC